MKLKSSRLIIVLALAALLLMLVVQAAGAQENPQQCPPGQEKQNGCKWVQHTQTGQCMWLPSQAVANPWVEVQPDGYCPPINGTQPPNETQPPNGTQPPYATPVPDDDREEPGGPGNLGIVIAGAVASLALLAGAGTLAWRNAANKRS